MVGAPVDFLPIYFVPFAVILVILVIMNMIHKIKYDKLMQHLEAYHPEIYEEIRIKPVWGPFYAKNAYKKSLDYANHHDPLDDPVAEELLADYANHSRKTMIVFIAVFLGWVGLLCWFGGR